MDQNTLTRRLSALPLGPVRYYESIGSTNEEAAHWAKSSAPDLALVVADEQTAGRGRLGRSWYTPPGAALAFSLVLRPEKLPALNPYPSPKTQQIPTTLTALGALAVADGIENYAHSVSYDLTSQIKWPNDVLVNERKLAGVLVENHWEGEIMAATILGIGINVAPPSVPPDEKLSFPATCVQTFLEKPVDRWELLSQVLASLLLWREKLGGQDFLEAWEERLAYKDKLVQVTPLNVPLAEEKSVTGKILGITTTGSLRLRTRLGEILTLHSGEVHLRPVDRSKK
jgi:BirA family biotin operon repressor/biotin-[acetyl-CoA-carboxylase] ligase